MNFASKNEATKWSKLAKIIQDRTEHSLKNRFFTLLSIYSGIAIRKLKKEKAYLTTSLIEEAISYHEKFIVYANNKEFSTCTLDQKERNNYIQNEGSNIINQKKIDSLNDETNKIPQINCSSYQNNDFLCQSSEITIKGLDEDYFNIDCFINFDRNEHGNIFF